MFLRSFLLLLLCCLVQPAFAAETRPHLDRLRLPYGCGTCHAGFSFGSGGGSDGCIWCHGGSNSQASAYLGPKTAPRDVGGDFRKPYRHPSLDIKGVHNPNEQLPETDLTAPRHADCTDCHNPHYLMPDNKYAGIRGRRGGNVTGEITKEYELCYRCHGDSANLPGTSRNKRMEFNQNNLSFHPVEGEGKNQQVISLVKPYREKKLVSTDVAQIGCHDCHGSDDANAPAGPHGSLNQYILVDNYSTRDKEIESPKTYALCYRCHSRTSILANESFRYHSLHIQGKVGGMPDGTSCTTCHSAHGSMENRYLVRFNTAIVTPNKRGQLKYVEKGIYARSGECYLSCHNVDHDPKSY